MGNQYRLDVEGDEFFVDLLYHLALSCFVVIELKTTDFKPEYSGQINFYVNVIDDKLRRPTDNPTIGIVLCRSTAALPEEFKGRLPSIEDLQHEIGLWLLWLRSSIEVIYMLESKRRSEMDNADVLAKKDAAVKWCQHASEYMQRNGEKPWSYILMPHDEIAQNMTLKGLADRSRSTGLIDRLSERNLRRATSHTRT